MKTIITLFITLIFIQKTVGQAQPSAIHSKDYYLQKSKTQKKTAWILLTGGTIMAVGGLIAFGDSWDSDSYTKTDILGFVTLGGVVADIASIPFFISAAKNKRKAGAISINYQEMLFPQQNTFILKRQPTITFHLKL